MTTDYRSINFRSCVAIFSLGLGVIGLELILLAASCITLWYVLLGMEHEKTLKTLKLHWDAIGLALQTTIATAETSSEKTQWESDFLASNDHWNVAGATGQTFGTQKFLVFLLNNFWPWIEKHILFPHLQGWTSVRIAKMWAMGLFMFVWNGAQSHWLIIIFHLKIVILRYRIFRQTQKTAFLSADIPGFDMRLDGFSPFFMSKPSNFRLNLTISPFPMLFGRSCSILKKPPRCSMKKSVMGCEVHEKMPMFWSVPGWTALMDRRACHECARAGEVGFGVLSLRI